MLISIIINICLLVALRGLKKNTDKDTLSQTLLKGAETAGKIIQSINPTGLKDTIELVKELVTDPTKEPKKE